MRTEITIVSAWTYRSYIIETFIDISLMRNSIILWYRTSRFSRIFTKYDIVITLVKIHVRNFSNETVHGNFKKRIRLSIKFYFRKSFRICIRGALHLGFDFSKIKKPNKVANRYTVVDYRTLSKSSRCYWSTTKRQMHAERCTRTRVRIFRYLVGYTSTKGRTHNKFVNAISAHELAINVVDIIRTLVSALTPRIEEGALRWADVACRCFLLSRAFLRNISSELSLYYT